MNKDLQQLIDWCNAQPVSTDDTEVPLTKDQAIARFLNRWCHRALGDRSMAEQELRELIEMGR